MHIRLRRMKVILRPRNHTKKHESRFTISLFVFGQVYLATKAAKKHEILCTIGHHRSAQFFRVFLCALVAKTFFCLASDFTKSYVRSVTIDQRSFFVFFCVL